MFYIIVLYSGWKVNCKYVVVCVRRCGVYYMEGVHAPTNRPESSDILFMYQIYQIIPDLSKQVSKKKKS